MFIDAVYAGRIWTNGNRVSSDAQTADVPLTGLPEGVLELFGKLAKVDGKGKLNGVFNYEPFQPGRKVTQDGFDQAQLYYSLHAVQDYLFGLGFDTQKIISSQHSGKPHPISGHANAVSDLNAWYSPQTDDLTFGTSGDMANGLDKWHLASDSDVTTHEAGHLILDHINKKLAGWWTYSKNYKLRDPGDEHDPNDWQYGEGRAIHEGFGDLLPAFFYDDPEMSEDFVPNVGRPESKTDGLRIVDNNLTLDDVGQEEHDRGQVYSGFFWAIKKQLSDPNGPFKLTNRQAADVCMKVLFNHASNYDTSRPKPKDFVNAVIKGAEGLASTGQLGVDLVVLKSVIMAEAEKRKMLVQRTEAMMAHDGIVKTFEEVESRFGKDVGFIPEQRTVFFGGSQEIYQQQYRLSSGKTVNVVGGSLFVQKNLSGKIAAISVKDVRAIKPGEIGEMVGVTPNSALTIAFGFASKQFNEAGNKAMNFRFAPMYVRPKEFVKALKEAQMEYRIAEAAVNFFRYNMVSPTPRLVIIPDSNVLHYEIKVGLGIYYINAQTGAATFKRDVLVN